MGDLAKGNGNGKVKNQGSNIEVESLEYSVEYTPSKSNLSSTEVDKLLTDLNPEIKTSEELYAALTDKNRAIEILKRRLTNQQIQLGYYLHKNLATEAVLEFSNKCHPHLAEDSTQLSLAMYKFIRDTGGKTRLAQLREKLTDYNNRVHKALLRQEQLVRQGLTYEDMEDYRKDEESITDEEQIEMNDDLRFAKKAYRNAKIELCSQLLSISLEVRKELERFRICAENVVRLEEERNALVDRVFTLPAEQRSSGLRVAMVDNIHRFESNVSIPSVTSVSTSTTVDVEEKAKTTSLGGALEDMESEAIQLLLLSEKQKNEFVIALEEARVENQQLRERLRDVEEAASDERVIQLQEKCNTIEREVEIMRKDLEAEQFEKEKVIKRMANELENRDANERNMKIELKKLKASNDLLRNERNVLQMKLEEKDKELINQITSTDDMLSKSETASAKNVADLTDLVVLQEEQIKDLLTIMSELKLDDDITKSVKVAKKSQQTDSYNSQEEMIAYSNDSGIQASEKKEPIEESDDHEREQQEDYNIYYDSASDFTNHDASEDGARPQPETPVILESHESRRDSKGQRHFDESDSKSQNRSRCRRRFFSREKSRLHLTELDHNKHGLATTSLRVQAFDKDGKSESMHAVLECTAPVDGLLEMKNSSKLHLRLQCTSPQRQNEYITSRDSSCPFCPDKQISGDHKHSAVVSSNNEVQHLSRDAKIYLSKQLNNIKSQLETSKSSLTTRKEIVQNLNNIYSQLFGTDEATTNSTRS